MWGDTGFQLCKYTCTELPLILPCCHFAAYYSFPEKKSVPGLNDQPTYMQFIVVNVVIKRLKYWCLVSNVDYTHHITEVVMRRD